MVRVRRYNYRGNWVWAAFHTAFSRRPFAMAWGTSPRRFCEKLKEHMLKYPSLMPRPDRSPVQSRQNRKLSRRKEM